MIIAASASNAASAPTTIINAGEIGRQAAIPYHKLEILERNVSIHLIPHGKDVDINTLCVGKNGDMIDWIDILVARDEVVLVGRKEEESSSDCVSRYKFSLDKPLWIPTSMHGSARIRVVFLEGKKGDVSLTMDCRETMGSQAATFEPIYGYSPNILMSHRGTTILRHTPMFQGDSIMTHVLWKYE